MTEYEIRYICGLEKTDWLFMVTKKIILPFHPNINDKIMIWDDFHEINNIDLILEDNQKYIIELKPCMLHYQFNQESSLKYIKKEKQEMIESGWKAATWYARLPDKIE